MTDATEARAIVAETFREWHDDDAMQWAAALSFYAALATGPLLVVLLGVASLAFDEETARRQLMERLDTWIGPQAVEVARTVLESTSLGGGVWATVVGLAVLLFGATTVFAHLQKALNRIWDVEVEEGGVRRMLRSRLLAFGLVMGVGMLLVAAVAARAVISWLPTPGAALQLADIGLSLAVFTLLHAAIFKVLPDVRIHWRDVWIGAAVTAALILAGRSAVGLYLGHASVGSAYGAAGSLVALLVWIYYTAMVFFFGAEFTQVWARRTGRTLEPEEGARRA